jgi:dipeptidyl aminopeptidase/acylaminoacyl peptidase
VTDRSTGLEGPDAPEGADTRVQAVCAGGAPVEFRTLPPHSRAFRYWLGTSPAEDPDLYRTVSPAAHLSSDDPPFLFFHGTNDRRVSLPAVQRMTDALKEHGVDARVYEARGTGHIATAIHPAAAWQARSFFLEHLAKPEATD